MCKDRYTLLPLTCKHSLDLTVTYHSTNIVRLGFPVRVLGKPGLRAYDGRHAHHAPHLSVSLMLLRDVITYLAQRNIGLYRMSDTLAPYVTSTHHEGFERQIEECADELASLGAQVRALDLRLTVHAGMHVALATPDTNEARRSVAEIVTQAALLDGMALGPDGVIVLHVGGTYGDSRATLDRFARRYALLPPSVRRRVVVEHDDRVWSLNDLLPLHKACGVPIVFDYLHHMLLNPEAIPLDTALSLALNTWTANMKPKVHFSSPRTEAHLGPRGSGTAVLPPHPGQHADFLNPFEFIGVLQAARTLPPFDMMLEAKAGDLALLRLRDDLTRYASELRMRIQ